MTMTSSGISDLVGKISLAFEDNDTLITACRDAALEIELGSTKIHILVEALGPYLTNTDIAARANGVKTLSFILDNLANDYLNESELNLLTSFFCDRLKDHHTIGPATIVGILAIVQMKNLPADAPARLFHCLFQHIRCQSELQETRRNIYRIFQILLQNRLNDLKSMGPDFVYGVISSMDGECDPRNLMILFRILPLFIKEFPLGHLVEEMFEVVACYFPIDFNASITGDKKKITREDLAEALAPCLYAIPEFAEFCLPHIMEKLDSDRKIAKLDSLNLLSKGVSTFRSKGLKNHLGELWPLLKKEAMSVSDREMKQSALETITELVKAVADDEQVQKDLVEKILADTRWSLCDVQLSLYGPAEELLEAVARAEKNSCTQVLREVIPLCLGQYSTKTSSNDKVTLMETLNNFIKISLHLQLTIGDIPELAWTDIPGLYLNELGTHDNALKAKVLSGLAIQKSSLKEGQRKVLYEKLCEVIDSDISGDVRNTCHSTVFAFAKLYPDETLDVLKKRLQIDVDNVDADVLVRRLEATSILSKISEIGVLVLPKIVEIAISKNSRIDESAMCCLYRILGSSNTGFDIHEYLYARCNTLERLLSWEDLSMKKLSLVSSVCRSIVQKLRLKDQQDIVNQYVITKDEKLTERDVVLFEGILTPLRQNVKIQNMESLINVLYKFSVDIENPETSQSSCRIIAALINKINELANFEEISSNLRQRIIDILESEESTIKRKKLAITLHTWLTKSLVTRGSQNSQEFLDYHINMLRLDTIGSCVAEEFKTLVDKSESTLTEENFCTIKIFYKQRIFQNVIQLNDRFKAESRQNYLVALAHLVEEVPIELPFMHLQGLVPLLVESLSIDDGQLLFSTLKTLKLLLETKQDIFLDQIQCFIPKCLQLSTYKKMNVRIAALDCLMSYCKYPTVELLKYKQDVLDKLAEPLDDHKRLVRQIAVKARTRWYLVGANGGPD